MTATKQCSKCGECYDFDLKSCPGCGYQGYRVMEVGARPVASAPPPPAATPAAPSPAAAPAAGIEVQLQVLRVLGVMTGVMMLSSLFMAWVQTPLGSLTYLKLCEMLGDNVEDAVDLLGPRVLAIFVPGLAALSVLVGGVSLLQPRKLGYAASNLLVGAFAAGLAVYQISDYVKRGGGGIIDLSGALGPGYQLYAGMSVLAVVAGVWALVLATGQQSHVASVAGGAGEVGSAAAGAGIFLQNQWKPMVAGFVCLALVGAGFGLAPKLKEAKEKAQHGACLSSVRQLGLAMSMYAQDYDERLPINDNWCDGLMPYTHNPKTYVCPALPKSRSAYAMNKNLRGAALRDVDFNAAMLYEYSGGWSYYGLPSEGLSYRHLRNTLATCYLGNGVGTSVSSSGDHAALDGPLTVIYVPPSQVEQMAEQAANQLTGLLNGGQVAVSQPKPAPKEFEMPDLSPEGLARGTASAHRTDTGDGFAVDAPNGWGSARKSDGKTTTLEFSESGGQASCKVQWQNGPASDIWAYPLRTEKAWQRKATSQYRRIAMESVTVAGNPGLRWEFVRMVDGRLRHTIDVFVNANGRGYAIWVRAPEAEWDRWQGTLNAFVDSFRLD